MVCLLWSPGARAATVQATTVGVYVTDTYGSCPDLPVMVDLWFHNGTSFEFHNRCFLNAGSAPSRPGQGVCYFKYPMPVGTPASQVLVRSWKARPDCTGYMDSVAPQDPNSYVDRHPSGDVVPDPAYLAYPARLVRVDARDYAVALDRNGGAIFEFYSKRATDSTLPAGKFESAIHAHFGAALQVAIHSGQPMSLTQQPCGGQGYWNPTQAGCSCSYRAGVQGGPESPAPGQGAFHVSCDGVVDDACTTAASEVSWDWLRMMNWDYGPGYEGPYAPADTSMLSQAVIAHPSFLEVQVRLRNDGLSRGAAWEVPTFYFTNRFRRFFYPDGLGGVAVQEISWAPRDEDNGHFEIVGREIPWICFENTGLSSGGDYFVTIGFLPGSQLRADVAEWYSSVSQGEYFDNIKFTYAPRAAFRQGIVYRIQYVVFPYRYDEIVDTPFGMETVADTIEAMRCVPDCSGKECGPDGCGGTCGTCPPGSACDPAGRCSQAVDAGPVDALPEDGAVEGGPVFPDDGASAEEGERDGGASADGGDRDGGVGRDSGQGCACRTARGPEGFFVLLMLPFLRRRRSVSRRQERRA